MSEPRPRSDQPQQPQGRPERREPPQITIRRPFFRRRKASPFAHPEAPPIDYKDVKLLQRFVSERAAGAVDGDQTRAASGAVALRDAVKPPAVAGRFGREPRLELSSDAADGRRRRFGR